MESLKASTAGPIMAAALLLIAGIVPAIAGPARSAVLSIPNLPANSASLQSSQMQSLATKMVSLINADRLAPAYAAETKGEAQPLQWDERLARVAQAHSEDMVRRHYFDHVDPKGDSPVERFYKAGVQWHNMGENIAINFTILAAQNKFMSEPPFARNHRGNILNPKFRYVGVGVAHAPDGRLYITQDFADEK
jgi:uncharacterized protein YkwD